MYTTTKAVKAQWANRPLQRNMQDGLVMITRLVGMLELCTVQVVALGTVLCPVFMITVMALMTRAWLVLAALAMRSGVKVELPDLGSISMDGDVERRGTARPDPVVAGDGEEEGEEDGPPAPPVARGPGPKPKGPKGPKGPSPGPGPGPAPEAKKESAKPAQEKRSEPRNEPQDEPKDEEEPKDEGTQGPDEPEDEERDEEANDEGEEDKEDEVDLDTLPPAVREAMMRSQGTKPDAPPPVRTQEELAERLRRMGLNPRLAESMTWEDIGRREQNEREKEEEQMAWALFKQVFGDATWEEAQRMSDPKWRMQAQMQGLDVRTGLPLNQIKKKEDPTDPEGGPSGPTGGGAPPPPPSDGGAPPPPPSGPTGGGAPPPPPSSGPAPAAAEGAAQASAAPQPGPAPAPGPEQAKQQPAPAAKATATPKKPKVPPARGAYAPRVLPRFRCELLDMIELEARRKNAPILKPGGVAGTRNGCIPPQFGLLGKRFDEKERPGVLIDYNRSFAAAFFGVPEYGKSYALGVMLENAVYQMDMGNVLPEPYCGFVLHYHPNATYQSEFLASRFPNCEPGEVDKLVKEYGILPQGFDDMVVLTLPEYVKELREQNPYTAVHGLGFALRSLKLAGLKILFGFGLGEESPLYQRQVEEMLRKLWEKHGEKLRLKHLDDAIARTKFRDKHTRELVESRLEIARPWINDDQDPRAFVKPGRLIIFDIREGWVPHETAMMLFALANNTMCLTKGGGKKMVVIDEAHKFAKVPIIRQQMGVMVRERRHLRLSLLLSCQDPGGLPGDLLPLLDMVGVFHHESEDWNRTLGKAIVPFQIVKVDMTSALKPGQMFFWARQWFQLVGGYDWKDAPIIVDVRPRASQHGGHTEESVRQPGAA